MRLSGATVKLTPANEIDNLPAALHVPRPHEIHAHAQVILFGRFAAHLDSGECAATAIRYACNPSPSTFW